MRHVADNGTCPICGGSSFVAKRTKKGVVAAGLFAPKRVRCVTCGESLKMGTGQSEAPRHTAKQAREQARAQYGHAIPRTPWEWWRRVRSHNRRAA